jgi:hypothetical protein
MLRYVPDRAETGSDSRPLMSIWIGWLTWRRAGRCDAADDLLVLQRHMC